MIKIYSEIMIAIDIIYPGNRYCHNCNSGIRILIIDNATADNFFKKFITKILSLIYFNLANRVYQIDNIFTSRYIYNS